MNNRILTVVSIIVIGLLWYFQYKITVNIPWWDDFHGIMLPVHDLFTNLSWVDKLKSFVSLNNEHRVVNDRVFTLLLFLFQGDFQLKTLAMLGMLNLVGIYLILLKVIAPKMQNFWYALPFLFLLFHAQYYESLQSLMVPFQNFSVLLYLSLSLYFLIFKENKTGGFLFAVAALLSHGNGILVFILGAIILYIQNQNKTSIYWIIASVITIALYFLGYLKPEWTSTDVISPWENPLAALRYAFEFLGAYALNIVELSMSLNQSAARNLGPQLAGLSFTILFLYLFFSQFNLLQWKSSLKQLSENKGQLFFFTFTCFFLATAVLMGLTRTGFAVLSRYTINSSFFLMGIWGFWLFSPVSKWPKLISWATAAVLVLSYYNAAEQALFRKDNAIADGVNFQINQTWSNQYSDSSHVSRLNPLLLPILEKNEYTFPTYEIESFNQWESSTKKESLDFSIVDDFLLIGGEAENKEVWFSLESDGYQFVLPTQKIRNNLKQVITHQSYFSKHYRAIYPIGVIPKGNYQIYKIEKENGTFKKYRLGRTLSEDKLIL